MSEHSQLLVSDNILVVAVFPNLLLLCTAEEDIGVMARIV